MKYVFIAVSLFASAQAMSAPHLSCEVKKYDVTTGDMHDCGSFTFRLPKEPEYGIGTGVCNGLQMWTSWQKGKVKKHAYELWAIGNKAVPEDNFAVAHFEGTFPENFTIRTGSKNSDYRINCAVKK